MPRSTGSRWRSSRRDGDRGSIRRRPATSRCPKNCQNENFRYFQTLLLSEDGFDAGGLRIGRKCELVPARWQGSDRSPPRGQKCHLPDLWSACPRSSRSSSRTTPSLPLMFAAGCDGGACVGFGRRQVNRRHRCRAGNRRRDRARPRQQWRQGLCCGPQRRGGQRRWRSRLAPPPSPSRSMSPAATAPRR